MKTTPSRKPAAKAAATAAADMQAASPAPAREQAAHEVLRLHFGEERWVRVVSQARTVMGWDEGRLNGLCAELLKAYNEKFPTAPGYTANAAACALLVAIKSKVGPNDEARLRAAREAMQRAQNG